jgi:hypothetical protein
MKRLLFLFVALVPAIGVLTFIIIPRVSIKPTVFGPDSARENQWKMDERVELESSEFPVLVRTNLQTLGAELTDPQAAALGHVLKLWGDAYSTNSFERFIRFRAPSRIQLTGTSLAEEANWLKKYRGQAMDGLPPLEVLQRVYAFDTSFALRQMARTSFQVKVFSVHDLQDSALNSNLDFHAGPLVRLGENSPCKYDADANSVLATNKSLLCVRVAAAFFTSVGSDHPIPVIVYFYWVPSETAWRPMRMLYGARVTGQNVEQGLSIYF